MRNYLCLRRGTFIIETEEAVLGKITLCQNGQRDCEERSCEKLKNCFFTEEKASGQEPEDKIHYAVC